MTLQDRAAQWLKTVEESWYGTTPGPWKAEQHIPGFARPMVADLLGWVVCPSNPEAMGRSVKDARAIASAPTHLSEGQALVRELLAQLAAKDERIDTLAGQVRFYKSKLDAAQTASEGE